MKISMRRSVCTRSVSIAAFIVLCFCGASSVRAQSLVKSRIVGAIRSDQVALVPGSLHPLVAQAQDQGQLADSTPIQGMSLVFRRSAAQQADLFSLMDQQQTRGSAQFHHWLTPAQFAARYGVSQSDLQAAAAWLHSQGFTIDQIPPSNDRIDFSGTAAQVAAAFHTELHQYTLQGSRYWANSTELSFPQAFAGMVIGVRHLQNFHTMVSHLKRTPVQAVRKPGSSLMHPEYTVTGSNGAVNYLAPADIQTIYDITALYTAGISGTGQYIGIMGQTDITQYMSDIKTFRSLSGLDTSNLPTQVVVPGTGTPSAAAGAASTDLGESDLDVEWAGAVAKDAQVVYVTVGSGSNNSYSVFDSLQYTIQTNLANNGANVIPVLSISYGNCEQNYVQSDVETLIQLGQQANLQGQTVVASAGDSGSADCDPPSGTKETAATQGLAVDFPASSPYTTAAGGTSFVADISNASQYWNESGGGYTTSAGSTNGSALSYIPEGAWNDTPTAALAAANGQLSAGGGGISQIFNASPNYSLSVAPTPPSTWPVLPSSLSYLAAKPSWQAGPGVPNDGARDLPDVSLAADPDHDGYVVCTEGTDSQGNITIPSCGGTTPYTPASGSGNVYGGTSVAAPQLAAMIVLWNQAAGYVITSSQAGGVGNANYLFYPLFQSAPAAFHDTVVSSNTDTNSNAVVCQAGTPSCIADPNSSNNDSIMDGYPVAAGYDLATGLGSVDAAAMAAVWGSVSNSGNTFNANTTDPNPDYQIWGNPAQVVLAKGSSTTVTMNVTSIAGFTGAVTLTCAGPTSDPGVTCNFGGASSITVTPGTSGTTTALTIQASTSASLQHPHSLFPQQPHPQNQPWQRFTGGGIAFAALFLFGLPGQRKRFLARFGKYAQGITLALFVLAICTTATLGCGSSAAKSSGGAGGGNITPPSTGPALNISTFVTVKATASGNSTATHSIELVYTLN